MAAVTDAATTLTFRAHFGPESALRIGSDKPCGSKASV